MGDSEQHHLARSRRAHGDTEVTRQGHLGGGGQGQIHLAGGASCPPRSCSCSEHPLFSQLASPSAGSSALSCRGPAGAESTAEGASSGNPQTRRSSISSRALSWGENGLPSSLRSSRCQRADGAAQQPPRSPSEAEYASASAARCGGKAHRRGAGCSETPERWTGACPPSPIPESRLSRGVCRKVHGPGTGERRVNTNPGNTPGWGQRGWKLPREGERSWRGW